MPVLEFFKINNTDLTPYMDYQSYEMNSAPVIREWTDGNMIDHRETIRYRRSGGFRLRFFSASDYTAFLNLLALNVNEYGFYTVSAFVQNTNATDTFYAFIDTSAEAKWDFVNGRECRTVTVTVRER